MAAPAIHILVRDTDMLVSIRVPGDKTFVHRMNKAAVVVETFLLPAVVGLLARLSPGHVLTTINGRDTIMPQNPVHEAMSREMLAYYQELPDDRWQDLDEEPAAQVAAAPSGIH